MKKFIEKFGFRSILSTATQADIDDSENQLNKKIPKDYAEFLLEWNGGIFVDDPRPIFQVDEFVYRQIVHLHGVGPFPVELVHLLGESVQHGYRFDELVPERFLAIGCGNTFEILCISTDSEDSGRVYSWYPGGYVSDDDVRTEEFLTLVAENFFDFWNNLIEGDTYELN